MDYYNKSEKEVLSSFNSALNGLSNAEARKRLAKYGFNELKETYKTPALTIFLSQFKSFIVYILIAAIAISLLVKQNIDALVIAIILLLNAVLGFIQEYKAEKSMEAIKKFLSLKAKVIRENKEMIIPARELVPGDMIVLEEGSKIPADSRLMESYSLRIDESTLTGESIPVNKSINVLQGKKQIADQKNMVFSSTNVVSGKGKAVITSTAESTEIGKIATLIQKTEKELTPLQKQLKIISKQLGIITIAICFLIFILVALKGMTLADSFIIGVALAVAAIPEGLPAIVTISLALGTQRMIKRNVLIKKLPSVETLGSTTVICVDKTGTLTLNKMTVTNIHINNMAINTENKIKKDSDIELLFKIGVFCNNAVLDHKLTLGDPTEAALLSVARRIGIEKNELLKKYPRLHEMPFSSERKIMSTINNVNNRKIMFTKGAPDIILKLCSKIYLNGKVRPLTKELKSRMLKANEEFAGKALRVLGFAYKEADNYNENNLIFVGLQGMIDPPRKDVKQSIKRCETAGIKVVMITGDHKLTAEAIAKELNITGKTMTGEELDKIKDLSKVVENIAIYARVNPIHKLKIVEALKKKGHVVAMTGDGVNDAPALKKSDIGIAIGSGTDVSKEASDMVLMDDNFSSIVNAVEEGRGIYNNITKFISYLLSSNIGEVLVIFFALIIGLPLPLLALQILWLNLVTDGLPALALSIDPIEKDTMKTKPRKKNENMLNKKRMTMLFLIGFIFAAGTIFLFKRSLSISYIYATTIAFTSVVIFEMFNVLNFRSETNSIFKSKIFNNKYLVLAIVSSLLLQLLVIYTPLNSIFKTVELPLTAWILIVAVSSSVLIIVEILKIFFRNKAIQ